MQSATPDAVMRARTDWGAIWGGIFTFAAIWAVFESLALAIFRTPAAATGMEAGKALWTIALTVIAMYIAGLETGRLAGIATRHDGLIHGLMMFGLVATLAARLNPFRSKATKRPVLNYDLGHNFGLRFGPPQPEDSGRTGRTRKALPDEDHSSSHNK